jgi:hypothetical protein
MLLECAFISNLFTLQSLVVVVVTVIGRVESTVYMTQCNIILLSPCSLRLQCDAEIRHISQSGQVRGGRANPHSKITTQGREGAPDVRKTAQFTHSSCFCLQNKKKHARRKCTTICWSEGVAFRWGRIPMMGGESDNNINSAKDNVVRHLVERR